MPRKLSMPGKLSHSWVSARLLGFSGCPGGCLVSPEALPLHKSCPYCHQREQPVVAQACFCRVGGIQWSLLVWGRWRAVDLRPASYVSNRVHIKRLNLVYSNHSNTTSSWRQNFSLQRCISSCRECKKLPSPAQKGTEKQYHLPLSPFPPSSLTAETNGTGRKKVKPRAKGKMGSGRERKCMKKRQATG